MFGYTVSAAMEDRHIQGLREGTSHDHCIQLQSHTMQKIIYYVRFTWILLIVSYHFLVIYVYIINFKDTAFLDLTLLEEHNKVMWGVTSLTAATSSPDNEGECRAQLV